MSEIYVGKSVGAVNDATDPMDCHEGRALDVSVVDTGSWNGTIVLERRFARESATDWRIVATYTAPVETSYNPVVTTAQYRLRCSARTAGTSKIELRQSASRHS